MIVVTGLICHLFILACYWKVNCCHSGGTTSTLTRFARVGAFTTSITRVMPAPLWIHHIGCGSSLSPRMRLIRFSSL